MFWLDGQRNRGRLRRARLDGTEVTTLVERLGDPGMFHFHFIAISCIDHVESYISCI